VLEETPDRIRRAFVPDGICDDVLLLPKSEVAMWGAERHSVGVWLTGLSAAIGKELSVEALLVGSV
jgi:hypothetical protein